MNPHTIDARGVPVVSLDEKHLSGVRHIDAIQHLGRANGRLFESGTREPVTAALQLVESALVFCFRITGDLRPLGRFGLGRLDLSARFLAEVVANQTGFSGDSQM